MRITLNSSMLTIVCGFFLLSIVSCESGCNVDDGDEPVLIPETPREVAYSKVQIYKDSFRLLTRGTITQAYALDKNILRSMIGQGHSLRVYNGKGSDGRRIAILKAVNEDYRLQSGEYVQLTETSLCPMVCDFSGNMTNEIAPLSANEGNLAIESYSGNPVDTIRSFVIHRSVIDRVLENDNAIGLQVWHGRMDGQRYLVMEPILRTGRATNVFLQNASGLCPMVCDVL